MASFLEENALDPCCAKELRDQKRSAIMRAKLQAVDPTRIALQRRQQALSTVTTGTLVLEHCCTSCPVDTSMCQACEKKDDYASDDSTLSDDLDSMMDSFSRHHNGTYKDDNDAADDDSAKEDNNSDQDDTFGFVFSTTAKTGTPHSITLQLLHPDRLLNEFYRRPSVVFLLVSEFDGISTPDRFLDGVAARLSVLSYKYDLTMFYIVVQPKDVDCRHFGVDRVPSLVCCMDGSVVARTTRLEQFQGRDSGGSDVGERLDPWLERCRMVGTALQSPESLVNNPYPNSSDDDHDDEDLQTSSFCSKQGCNKTFHHTHIDVGAGINAQDLSVTK
jgi:hypothetical protein|tara:strand:+ start:105 stop:1100 length:996 start_codon:yes stop_codon:yes gene_type:complete